MLDRAA
ncbi:hypothetical protein D046_4000A, partial [Vibrio parahaemolyticus V-223/04]